MSLAPTVDIRAEPKPAAGAQLGAFLAPSGSDADDLLRHAAQRGRALGLRVGGVIQVPVRPGEGCDGGLMLEDLATGQRRDIWQFRGPNARGCRLDQGALADTVAQVERAVAGGIDLLIINRFGASESLGRGMVPAMVAALDRSVPVLTCLRPPYAEAWDQFHGGMARALEPTEQVIAAWIRALKKPGT